MTYRKVKSMTACNMSLVNDLYTITNNTDTHVDESDLVIFRLMDAQFEYASVEFEESSPAFLQAESVAF